MKKTKQELLAENDELRARLEEAEETLNAIRGGEVDALIVDGKDGQQIYTLAAADRSYRLLLESMQEGAVTLNPDGFIIYCNAFFAKLLKIPLDKLIGAHLAGFIPQSESRFFLALLAQHGRGETKLKAADNSLVPVYLSVNMLSTKPGQQLSCLIVTDLTEQKRDEKIIAEGRLSKIIFDKAPEAIIVCDEKGKIIRASISAHALCGQNPLYKPFDELFPLTLEQGKHFTITQALSRQEVQSSEAGFLRKGDAPFVLVLTSAPLVDENNKLIGCIVTLSDITERKRAEAETLKLLHELQVRQIELQQQQETILQANQEIEAGLKRYTELYDFAPIGYFTLLGDGAIQKMNLTGASLFGEDQSRILNRRLGQFIALEYRIAFSEALKKVFTTGEKQICEAELLTDKPNPISVEILLSSGNDGQTCRAVLSDITLRKQSDNELRKSEQRFRALAEDMPHFVWEADADGVPIYANQRFYDYSGLSPEQALAGGWLAVQHPEDAPRVEAAWRQALTSYSEYDLESRFRQAATGAYRWFRIKGSPVRDAAGRIIRWVGTCTDVHEQKQAGEAQRESEERLRLLGDNLPDSVVYQYVIEPGGEIRFLYVSAGIEGLTGVSVQELMRDARVLPRQVPEEYAARIKEAEARSARDLSDFDMELPMRRPDGQMRWMHLHSRPRRMPDGSVVWDGVQTDITGRKRAEEALAGMGQMLSSAQEIAHLGSFEYIAATRTTVWSEEEFRIYGLDPAGPSPAYDVMLAKCIHPDDAALLQETFAAAMRSGSAYELEHRIVRPDGSVRCVYDRAQPYFNGEGELVRYVGATLDITERKQLEMEQTRLLNNIQEEKDRLQALVNSISDEVWFADIRKRFILANPSALASFGLNFDAGAIDMQKFSESLEVLRPDGSPRPAEESPALRALGGEVVRDMEEIIRMPASGELRHRQVSSNPVRNAGGRIIGSVSVVRDITERKALEKVQLFLLRCGNKEGEDFFESLAVYLAEHLRMDFVCIDKLADDRLSARTLAMYCDGKLQDNIEYTLQDTPCGDVVEHTICSFKSDVRRLFPKDAALQDLRAESYVGTTLWSAQGEPIGLIAVIGRKPLADTSFAETILKLVGIRTAGEMERRQAEDSLRVINARLDILAESASQLLKSELPQKIVEVLCRRVMAFLDCQAFFNFLADEERGQLHLNACAGIPPEEAAKIEWLDYGIAVCGCAARDGCRIVAEDILHTPDIRTELVKSYGIQAYACHPLLAQGEVIGTLSFGTRTRPRFTEDELALMKAMADQVAIAMERNQSQIRIESLNRNLQRRVQELEALFNTVPIGITIADDPEGNHIRGNPLMVRMLGMTSGAELSLNPASGRASACYKALQNGQELPAHELPMQRAARGETVAGQMLDIVRQDGRTLNLYSNAAPLFDEHGRPRGAIGAFLDITELKQVENALRQANKLLEMVTKGTDVIIVTQDTNFRYTYFNMAFQEEIKRLTGKDVRIGMSLVELLAHMPEQQALAMESWRRTLRGESFNERIEFGDPGRHRTVYNVLHTPLRDMEGAVVGAGEVAYNITRQVKIETALRTSEERLRLANQAANEGIWDLNLADGRLLTNDTYAELYGRPERGNDAPLQWWLGRIHPEDRDLVAANFQYSLDGKSKSCIQEYRLQRVDGSWAYVYDRAFIARDGSGKAYRVIGATMDMTERREAETALQLYLERLDLLIKASVAIINEKTAEGAIRQGAEAARKLTGARVAVSRHGYANGLFQIEASSRSDGVQAFPEEAQLALQKSGSLLDIIRNGEAVCFTDEQLRSHPVWRVLPEGHWPLRGLCGAPLKTQEGVPSGLIMVSDKPGGDFTEADTSLLAQLATVVSLAVQHIETQAEIEKKAADLISVNQQLQEEIRQRMHAEQVLLQYTDDLKRINEELDGFTSAVSHDIQEPLRSIAGFMRLLDKKYGDLLDSRGKEYIERSIASAKRLGAMINSLLAYSHITTRGKDFDRYELDAILETALENLNASISQTKALITREQLPHIYGDHEQLVRVFQNLIGNSIKYCENRRPEIHVSWQRKADACIIAVKDNGEGIDPDYLANIFDLFTRGSSKQTVSGTGMGLALCKKIIARHRGKIWVESVPGEGATFFFSLPVE